jgi:hypothetical protein
MKESLSIHSKAFIPGIGLVVLRMYLLAGVSYICSLVLSRSECPLALEQILQKVKASCDHLQSLFIGAMLSGIATALHTQCFEREVLKSSTRRRVRQACSRLLPATPYYPGIGYLDSVATEQSGKDPASDMVLRLHCHDVVEESPRHGYRMTMITALEHLAHDVGANRNEDTVTDEMSSPFRRVMEIALGAFGRTKRVQVCGGLLLAMLKELAPHWYHSFSFEWVLRIPWGRSSPTHPLPLEHRVADGLRVRSRPPTRIHG